VKPRHLFAVAGVACCLIAIPLAAVAQTTYYAMAGGSTLHITCPGHLGEGTPGSPYVLACTRNGPSPTTTLPVTSTTVLGPSTTTVGRTTTTVGRTTTTRATTTTSVPSSGYLTPPASLMPDSIFDQPVTGDSVLPNSSAIVANVVAQSKQNNYGLWVNYNRPVYYVAAGTPNVPMSVQSGCNNFTSGGAGATGTEVPIPSFAEQGGSSDNILTIYSTSLNKVWEFWEAQPNKAGAATSWSACWGAEATLSTFTGVFPHPYSETATGISNLATEITEADVASGAIKHAIEFEVYGDQCDWYVAPAVEGDCSQSGTDYPAEGMYFRFPPTMAMPAGLSAFSQMEFIAIQRYGMVVSDMGGAVDLEADVSGGTYKGTYYSGPWEQEGQSASTDPLTNATDDTGDLPWADLQAINYP
jgi:hypothetical protein